MLDGQDDCWDVFGSDDDGEEENEGEGTEKQKDEISIMIAAHLAQTFVKDNPQIRLSDRVVGVIESADDVARALEQRGMHVLLLNKVNDDSSAMMIDALVGIVVPNNTSDAVLLPVDYPSFVLRLVPGGLFITNQDSLFNHHEAFLEPNTIRHHHHRLVEYVKRPIRVHVSRCPWLPPSHSIVQEEKLLHHATITPSVHEMSQRQLNDHSIQHAVQCLNQYGYCVVRCLLDKNESQRWGKSVLASVHSAAKVLLERDQVDIYHPHTSQREPQAYRELSMREDLRLDLRHGPELSLLRSSEDQGRGGGNESMVLSGQTTTTEVFLRGNPTLLEILRRTMNPKRDDLFQGNLGRFNFGGSGPDGSYQDIRLSPVGGIVTLPGCGDQSIHADTPHLFEHIPDLPAHYINIFAAGTPFHENLGGTAFVHGSHNLEFTAKHCPGGGAVGYHAVYPYLVRPCLDLGDVVLFDCRILHFGMSNTSSSEENTERVLLYTNATQAWFHDPKNWDDRRRIFDK